MRAVITRTLHASALTAAILVVSGCDHGPAIGANPTPTTTPKADTGGVCGDGRVIRPGEHCP